MKKKIFYLLTLVLFLTFWCSAHTDMGRVEAASKKVAGMTYT